MKIGNHYGTFGQNNYEQPHSHHVTDCLHEESDNMPKGGMNRSRLESAADLHAGAVYEKTDHIYGDVETTKKAGVRKRHDFSMAKGFWDSLGEDGKKAGAVEGFSFKENILPGIAGAASAFRQRLSDGLVSGIKGIRNRIKTEAGAALKRFGRGQEAFTALSDQKTSSRQKNLYSGAGSRKEELRTTHKEEKPMKLLVHSHLMDSYSKTGAYCQLNENLTYQKQGKRVRERKETEKAEKE